MTPALPILDARSGILGAVANGRNLVVTAPTGSGKSTRIPQMLLDSGLCTGRILILQPRRIAARMLAARVAEERGSELGGEIGFQTRFETLVSEATRACFITEGILPRMLLSNRTLSGVSAVIFDEFHERNLATDVGLAVVADLARTRRPDMRLVVMSATIAAAPVADFLGNAEIIDCPGRIHPIDLRHVAVPKEVSPWDAATDAVRSLIAGGAEGDILVFMPGAYEIRRTIRSVEEKVRAEPVKAVPLYGDMPAVKQHEAMEQFGRRKVIVATNIAETSLTIPGVRHVVDSGLARINRYDPARGLNTLFIEPVSRASADQRAGRAGREGPGICVRLWSAAQHTGRAADTAPEIRRADLAETVLQLRMLGYHAMDEVPWFERPEDAAVRDATGLLGLLGALDREGELTERGMELCRFPMHPRLATLLVEAGKRGAAGLAAFTAALLSERPAIFGRPEYPEPALKRESISDLYGHYCLLEKARTSGFDRAVCARYGISASAAQSIYRTRDLFLDYCRKSGIDRHDREGAPEGLCRSLLAAYPDHLCVRRDKGTLLCTMREGRRGELAKESIVRKARLFVAADIREIRSSGSELKTLLSLAAEVREEWLLEDFPDAWSAESALEYNSATGSVEGRTRTSCLGVVISVSEKTGIDPLEAASLLAETIVAKNLELSGWDQGVEEWLDRARWVAGLFPEQGLPLFTKEDRLKVVEQLCEGEARYEAVRRKPVLPILQGMLTFGQRELVERMAPPSIALPSGRKMKIAYKPDAPPRGRAKIQDLYGLRETPRVAGGKAPVLVEILAPNNRPVQITGDIARFWEVHYPEVRKTLSRRYPKHEWR